MKTDLLIRSTTCGGGCQITLGAIPSQNNLDSRFSTPRVNVDLRAGAARHSGPLRELFQQLRCWSPVICSSTARSQSDPPKHAARTPTDTANEALHLSIILVIPAEVRHFLHFITNTMFHWQQRTAEICHNKNGIMLIYHNNYDKNKRKKGEKAGISSFSTCVEMLSLRLLRATWSCPHPDLLLLQQFALEKTKAEHDETHLTLHPHTRRQQSVRV